MPSKNKTTARIGIDLLGSDFPPEALLPALPILIDELAGRAELIVFGTPHLASQIPPRVEFIGTDELITMEDNPLTAVRVKKKSSLCIGMHYLGRQELDALISAGNTGALVACASLTLNMLPDIDRPALLTLLPSKDRDIAVLDVGANLACKAKHLVQFAFMGIAYQKCRGVVQPKAGLLNIGAEAQKGTPELREAYEELRDLPGFLGNIEARDVFHFPVDVLVTDGFTGNVFLKTCEGIASALLEQLEEISSDHHLLTTMRQRLLYAEYPGALLCGVDGLVIKCHGNASSKALIRSVQGALELIEHEFLDSLKNQLTLQ